MVTSSKHIDWFWVSEWKGLSLFRSTFVSLKAIWDINYKINHFWVGNNQMECDIKISVNNQRAGFLLTLEWGLVLSHVCRNTWTNCSSALLLSAFRSTGLLPLVSLVFPLTSRKSAAMWKPSGGSTLWRILLPGRISGVQLCVLLNPEV